MKFFTEDELRMLDADALSTEDFVNLKANARELLRLHGKDYLAQTLANSPVPQRPEVRESRVIFDVDASEVIAVVQGHEAQGYELAGLVPARGESRYVTMHFRKP